MTRTSGKRSLIAALSADTIGAASGLPMGLIGLFPTVARHYAPHMFPDYYLKWDDIAFTAQHYRPIWANALSFKANGQSYTIPTVKEASCSPDNTPEIYFNQSAITFSPDKEVTAQTEKAYELYRSMLKLRRRRFDPSGRLLRLANCRLSGNRIFLDTQCVEYSTVCRTNMLLDAPLRDKTRSLRALVQPSGNIEPLSASRLGNPVGINALLFTADEAVAMPARSRKVLVRPLQLGPSYSGDLEYTDVPSGQTRLAKIPILREGFEELGLRPEDVVSQAYLGMTRELVRGGKPEIFYELHTNLTREEIQDRRKIARDRWESSPNIKKWYFWNCGHARPNPDEHGRQKLRVKFGELLSEQGHRISIPLLTNLVLWMQSRLGTQQVQV